MSAFDKKPGGSSLTQEPDNDQRAGVPGVGKRTLTGELKDNSAQPHDGGIEAPGDAALGSAADQAAPSSTLALASGAGARSRDRGTSSKENPSTSAPLPMKAGGDTKSKKIVRVAWTVDDGPNARGTPPMKAQLGARPATWYIQRNRIEGADRDKKLADLKAAQDAGSEIAIHGLHRSTDHATWFPTNKDASYPSIDAALKDLAEFKALLTGRGINAKMVRLPYGLVTELQLYLTKLAVEDPGVRAREIINGADVSKRGKAVAQVKEDFATYKTGLESMGLHEWGGEGPAAAELTMAQSWQAESAPPGKNLADTVTGSHGGQIAPGGEFEKRCDRVTEKSPEWLVVLSHDSGAPAAKEAGEDVQRIESYAMQKGVRVEYYTMSELYQIVRGHAP